MISECPPSVEYEAVIQSEDAVLTWLENVVSPPINVDNCLFNFFSITTDFAL